MKIAIVAPSPVPFVIGGAEKLWWGLLENLNQSGEHQVELIKIPSPENDFWSIMRSYYNFSLLDLQHFDRIITTKYPAWIVSHPEHVVYLQHRLRGLYDCYPDDLPLTPFEILNDLPESWQAFLNWVKQEFMLKDPEIRKAELQSFWDRLFALESESQDAEFLTLPGPLCRYLVHCLDQVALDQTQIHAYYSISKTVAKRSDYFPHNVIPKVISHPSDISIQPTFIDKGYIFTASRLDAPKRIDVLLKAYAEAGIDLPLKIAGTGPQQQALKELSLQLGIANRVIFLGFVSNDNLVKYYQSASFVVFVPYDEDMGLITLEAQQAAKAVLTLHDSGGVTEFVKNGINGFIAKSTSELAERFRELAMDTELTKKLGNQAYQDVQFINWEEIVYEFTKENITVNTRKQKMLVVNTFNCYPVDSCGKARMYHLYEALSAYYQIEMIVVDTGVSEMLELKFSDDFTQWIIPASEECKQYAAELEQQLGISAFDLAVMLKPELNTEFCRFIAVKAIEAETIVSSHCYVFPSILLSTRNLVQKGGVAKLVYDAHNVEYLMKKEMVLSINSSAQLNSTVTGILQDLQKIEESLINTSQEIWSCSSDDQVYFQDILKKDHAHSPVFKVIPNGESFGDKKKYSLDEKKSLKQELGLAGFSKLTVFIGSLHLPNVIALKNILNIARSCPEIGFLIIGSVCNARDEEELLLKNNASDNVFFMGVLDEPVKAYLMSIADIGLNPVSEGSGTNLKNFDYLKHYLYVVSTPKGVRGLPPIFDVIELDAFANTLNDIAKQNEDILNQKVMKMRFQIARIYDWKQISKQVVATLQN